jgi:uncharacterized protein
MSRPGKRGSKAWIRVSAAFVVVSIALAACGSDSKSATTTTTSKGDSTTTSGVHEQTIHQRSLTIYPLFYSTDANGKGKGGTEPVTIQLQSQPGEFRVGFSEDEVSGTGDQWRAAGWDAATVATILLGTPVTNRQVTFQLQGDIDGPSAGALMTIGTLALLRGDTLKNNITMTGTINPDGTIGPVGGIPYKIDGVVAAKKTVFLVPEGQRNSPDDSGNLVDIVKLGKGKGVQVEEVANIYDAYKLFTGKTLPRAATADNTSLSDTAYGRLKTVVNNWLAKYTASVQDYQALDPTVRTIGLLKNLAAAADSDAQKAQTLQTDGLQAGALNAAVAAAAEANAAVRAGQAYQIFLTQGIAAFENQIKLSSNAVTEIKNEFSDLDDFTPTTVSDASDLIQAYGNLTDAVSYTNFAQSTFDAISKTAPLTTQADQAVEGAIYLELAGTIAQATQDAFDAAKGLGGAPLSKNVNLQNDASFFRKAAAATLTAFDTIVISEAATSNDVTIADERNTFANNDSDYLLALYGQQAANGSFSNYLSSNTSRAYAQLGAAVALYGRSSSLLAKYYSLGNLDSTGNVVVRSPRAIIDTLNFAQDQVGRAINLLRTKKVDPTLAVAAFEQGSVDREGTTDSKFSALDSYWTAFVQARVLSYLGGFSTSGV